MPTPEPPPFNHDNETVENYIKMLIKEGVGGTKRSQLILMAGISLNNVKLIKYACEIDPNVVNLPVPEDVLNATDAVLSPVTGKHLSSSPAPISSSSPATTPN